MNKEEICAQSYFFPKCDILFCGNAAKRALVFSLYIRCVRLVDSYFMHNLPCVVLGNLS